MIRVLPIMFQDKVHRTTHINLKQHNKNCSCTVFIFKSLRLIVPNFVAIRISKQKNLYKPTILDDLDFPFFPRTEILQTLNL